MQVLRRTFSASNGGGYSVIAAYIGDNTVNNSGLCENIPSLRVLEPIVPVTISQCQGKSAEVEKIESNSAVSLQSSASQRVNPEYLQWLVGLTDGEGTFCLVKNRDRFLHRFAIGMNSRDLQLLYYLNTLIGCGRVDKREVTSNFSIAKMEHLLEFVVPIFEKYPLLTRKKFQFELWSSTLQDRKNKEPILVKPEYLKDVANDILSIEEILKLEYFDNWLMGFIEAEGCFSISKENGGKRIRPYFYIDQKYDAHIMGAISKRLHLRDVQIRHSRDNMYALSAKSKRELQSVLNFIAHSKIKFVGHKGLQFKLWIKEIQKLPNYSSLNLPIHY